MEKRIAERMENFLDNHWPHMETRIGRLEGQSKILLAIGTLTLGGIVTLLIKAL